MTAHDPAVPPPAGYVDMLPCEVAFPTGHVIRRARVVAHENRIVVWAENPSEPSDVTLQLDVPVLAVHEWPDPYAQRRHQRLVVETSQGRLSVNAIRGCGCGGSSLSSVDAAQAYPVPLPATGKKKT